MGDYKASPGRSKKFEPSKKGPKEIVFVQKPKSKTRISSPETLQKSSPSSNRSSHSNI